MIDLNSFWSLGGGQGVKAHLFSKPEKSGIYTALCDSRIIMSKPERCDDKCSRCYNYVMNFNNYHSNRTILEEGHRKRISELLKNS